MMLIHNIMKGVFIFTIHLYFLRNFYFLKLIIFLVFLVYFNVLILKINF